MMIERLLGVRPHLEQVLQELKHDLLSNKEWARLSECHSILLPFKEHTDYLQTDTLSLSSVIPCLLELSLHLKDQSLPRAHADTLLKSLHQRFSVFLDPTCPSFDPLPAAACLLDPTVARVLLRDDMVQLLEAAKTYTKAQVRDYNSEKLLTEYYAISLHKVVC